MTFYAVCVHFFSKIIVAAFDMPGGEGGRALAPFLKATA